MINKPKGFLLRLNKKALIIGAIDVLSISVAFFMALWMRFDFSFRSIIPEYLSGYGTYILPWCGI